MKAVDALRSLEELGSMQWGLVTAGQAGRLGVNRVTLGRLSDRDVLTRLRHGVYSLPSADFGPLQELRAAWLAIDSQLAVEERVESINDAVVSHTSAAAVHGLGDLVSIRHEFTSPIRRQSSQGDIRFHRADVRDDKVIVDGLPVTSVERTVADLAVAHTDFDHLATMVRDAMEKADVSAETLSEKLTPQTGRYGYAGGSELIEACLEKAGLPHAAGEVLKHYPNAVRRAWAPQLEGILKPMMENLAQKHFRPELNAQQDMIRSLLRRGAFKELVPSSAFSSVAGLDLVPESLRAEPALSAALIKALAESADARNAEYDDEDDGHLPPGGEND